MSNIQFDSSFTKAAYTQAVISNFTSRAPTYNNDPKTEIRRNFIETLVTFYPPSYPLLDIACGTGLLGAFLGTGHDVYGIDLTEAMLVQARRACPDGKFVQASAESLPFDDGNFGSVYICSALVYFTNVPGCLKEAYRVLKDGGFLAYQAVTLDSYVAGVVLEKAVWHVLGEEKGRYVFELPHGITNDEPANIRLMENAGFVDISAQKDTVVDQMDIENLEKWWSAVVQQNGLLRRVAMLSEDELRAIHDFWVQGMERRRGVQNTVEDRITSWYVCGYKRDR